MRIQMGSKGFTSTSRGSGGGAGIDSGFCRSLMTSGVALTHRGLASPFLAVMLFTLVSRKR